ncbi:hypothetical protein Ga0466249_001093 [Sporomusaceae bacterium BoRhaA]|uniref:CehA/McbA family metallohydrolase n=1 Tax=Pelorhabdus rhamnosifermentans TaxID=2772457 RepID=UPI001C061E48|nr:CehA/McbA family metallohydrolase [Pelorhabdus rhamnosifermentans]MBU2700001.1 hypothetical protein [Pelorhabdus rhamnosifermentans]
MTITINGLLGSGQKLASERHQFFIKELSDCLELKIKTPLKSWIQVLLWDPDGNLRLQCLHLKEASCIPIHVDPLQNYPAAIPGKIVAGEYTLEVIGNGFQSIPYVIEVRAEMSANDENRNHLTYEIWSNGDYAHGPLLLNCYDAEKMIDAGVKWYKGDFHTHTNLSDGKLSQVELLHQAEQMELDFIVATDHNILPVMWVKGNVLVIPGMEITSQSSHFNAIGLNIWLDFRGSCYDLGLYSEQGMNRLLSEAKEKGALCSINHPALAPWQWEYTDTLLANVDMLEIINDPTYPGNKEATEKALELWTATWNEGYHIWGIGGSDSHLLPTETYEGASSPSLVGDPGTYVLSNGLSAKEIINAVRQGRVYVSRGIKLNIKIRCQGQCFFPGDDLTSLFTHAEDEHAVVYCIKLIDSKDNYDLTIIENGVSIVTMGIESEVTYQIPVMWKGSQYVWNRLDIRNAHEEMVLFTNPVYKGGKTHTIAKFGELQELVRRSLGEKYSRRTI